MEIVKNISVLTILNGYVCIYAFPKLSSLHVICNIPLNDAQNRKLLNITCLRNEIHYVGR